MKICWEKKCPDCVKFIELVDRQVLLEAKYNKAPDMETIGICTFYEFLHGKFQDIVEDTFGIDVLKEVLSSVSETQKEDIH